ncbi:hypothetical protein QBC39DRAFT_416801 [Podospora conica]|nr:hypothetical protein QBC39DRAFT_416801 [Schizothecium conicum]
MDTTSDQPASRHHTPQVHPSQHTDQTPAAARRPSAPGSSAANTANFSRNQARYRVSKGRITPQFPGLTTRPRTRSVVRLEELEKEEAKDPEPEATPTERSEYDHGNPADDAPPAKWAPSFSIGSPLWLEGEDLSRIEIADRNIAQNRLMVEFYRGVPAFAEYLDEAIKERNQLDENDVENTLPLSKVPSIQKTAITSRITHLRDVLETSTFPPERSNILAAIAGYESGAIPFSTTSYTLIWAGLIVDRCPSHHSFTHDRVARLDRYAAAHGPGWLWYEPPLTTSPTPSIRAMKGVCLPTLNRATTENMGHYTIRMSFRRRQILSTRPCPSAPPPLTPAERRHNLTTGPSPSEPRVFFNMLLDTGATFPCLYTPDLLALNIDPRRYAAVSSRSLAMAQGSATTKTYELDVAVHAADGSSLVTNTPDNPPAWPAEQDLLGGVCSVIVFPGAAPAHGRGARGVKPGEEAPDRLSGMLPFHVAYWSSAPGNYQMWMGEDRREVLGASRLPGQMRFAAWKEEHAWAARPRAAVSKELPYALDTGRPVAIDRMRLGTPERVVFEHKLPGAAEGVVVRDKDAGGGRSVITVGPRGSTGQKRQVYRVEPRKLAHQQEALRKRQRQPSEEPSEESSEQTESFRKRPYMRIRRS